MVGCDYGIAADADLAYANKHGATHIVPNIFGFQQIFIFSHNK